MKALAKMEIMVESKITPLPSCALPYELSVCEPCMTNKHVVNTSLCEVMCRIQKKIAF